MYGNTIADAASGLGRAVERKGKEILTGIEQGAERVRVTLTEAYEKYGPALRSSEAFKYGERMFALFEERATTVLKASQDKLAAFEKREKRRRETLPKDIQGMRDLAEIEYAHALSLGLARQMYRTKGEEPNPDVVDAWVQAHLSVAALVAKKTGKQAHLAFLTALYGPPPPKEGNGAAPQA